MLKKLLSKFKKKVATQQPEKKATHNYIKDLINEHFNAQYKNVYSFRQVQVATANGTANAKVTNDSGVVLDSFDDYGSYTNIAQMQSVTTQFMGWGVLSFLATNGIVQNIINSIAGDSTSKWGKIINTSNDDLTDEIKQLEQAMADFNIRKLFNEVAQKTVLFGGCQLYAKIKGDEDVLNTEFILSDKSIGKGDVRYFRVVEPLYSSAYDFNSSDPLAKNFYEPQMWNIMGQEVHTSRLMRFNMNDTPIILKPQYMFYGISLIQLCLSKIAGFEETYNNVLQIMAKYNVNVLKTSASALSNVLDGNANSGDVDSIQARIQLFNKLRTNFGTLLLDKESEEWEQFNMNLTTLDKLVNQNLELISAYARIPATKLFGTSPQGFNATGKHELINYYDMLTQFQENVLQNNMNRVMEYLQLTTLGKLYPELKFVWNPLHEASETDQSTINLNDAQRISTLVASEILTQEEAREYLANNEKSGFDNLDTDLQITGLVGSEDNPDE